MTSSTSKNKTNRTVKFMQTLLESHWNQLQTLAEDRGITVQEYIRIFVVSDFLKYKGAKEAFQSVNYSNRVKKGWETRRQRQEQKELEAKELLPK